jgi:phosphoribosylanthranilate isomerase
VKGPGDGHAGTGEAGAGAAGAGEVEMGAVGTGAAGAGVAVKICGVCSAADAAMAAAAGASYIGVILLPGRPRSCSVPEASAIFGGIGGRAPGVRRVGVFADASVDEIRAAVEALDLDVVQLHGEEDAAFAGAIRGLRVWKAIRVRSAADVVRASEVYAGSVDGLLLEGWSERGAGGVGAAFDREAVSSVRDAVPGDMVLIAAGGLTPGNVGRMIELLRPDVVDVSSGVEEAMRRKSSERVRAFIAAAQEARAGGQPEGER